MPVLDTPMGQQLETFADQYPGRDYTIEIVCPEFTKRLPDDWPAGLRHHYLHLHPGRSVRGTEVAQIVSAKFSQPGHFLRTRRQPLAGRFCRRLPAEALPVVGAFTVRGGITTTVTSVYEATNG